LKPYVELINDLPKKKTKQIKSSPDDRPKNIADQRSETVKAACLILLIVDQGLMRNN